MNDFKIRLEDIYRLTEDSMKKLDILITWHVKPSKRPTWLCEFIVFQIQPMSGSTQISPLEACENVKDRLKSFKHIEGGIEKSTLNRVGVDATRNSVTIFSLLKEEPILTCQFSLEQ